MKISLRIIDTKITKDYRQFQPDTVETITVAELDGELGVEATANFLRSLADSIYQMDQKCEGETYE